jgi:hypothetical protein
VVFHVEIVILMNVDGGINLLLFFHTNVVDVDIIIHVPVDLLGFFHKILVLFLRHHKIFSQFFYG